jgi:hypothetical protein
MHTSKPLVPEPSSFELEISIEKLKRNKSSVRGERVNGNHLRKMQDKTKSMRKV